MGSGEHGALAELLDLLAGHPRALARPMAALMAAEPAQPAWALASASKFS